MARGERMSDVRCGLGAMMMSSAQCQADKLLQPYRATYRSGALEVERDSSEVHSMPSEHALD